MVQAPHSLRLIPHQATGTPSLHTTGPSALHAPSVARQARRGLTGNPLTGCRLGLGLAYLGLPATPTPERGTILIHVQVSGLEVTPTPTTPGPALGPGLVP